MQEQTKVELLKIALELTVAVAHGRKDGVGFPSQTGTTLPKITDIYNDCLEQVEKSFNGLGGTSE